MQQVPECPRCGVEVQPHWDRCEKCGYSHHDDADLDAAAAPPVEAAAPAPGFFDAPAPGAAPASPVGLEGSDEPVTFDLPPADDADAPPPPPPPPPPPVDPGFESAPRPVDPGFGSAPRPVDPGFGSAPRPVDPGLGSAPPPDAPPPPPPPPPDAAPPGGPDPLSRWEAQASPAGPATTGSAPAPAPGGGGGTDEAGSERPARSGKRITAADGARSTSPFQLNKVVVGVAVVLAALVLIWQATSLLKSDDSKAAAPTGTTIPPLGAIATTTTPLTTPDGIIIAPPETTTTTINSQPQCDSSTAVYSADGRGYRPCGGGFQVDLPGRADVRSSSSDTALGAVKWTSLTSTDNTKDPWVRSVVVYGDLPREVTPDELAGVQEALVTQLFAKPGATTTFLDLPALTFTGTDPNGDEIVGIAFVRGTKAFAVATKSNGSPEAGFEALRDSFAFL